jgi:hypothetical protein
MPDIDLGARDGMAGGDTETRSSAPGVGKRTSDAPLAQSGWSSRQNGPSMLA